MTSIDITILNTRLEDLGIECNKEYATFEFNPKRLSGFWLCKDYDGIPDEICVYIDGREFYVAYSDKVLRQLREILEENSKR